MITSFSPSMPSISFNSWHKTLSDTYALFMRKNILGWPLSCNCVNFIKENDTRTACSCSLENVSNCLLGVSYIFRKQLWTFDANKVQFGLSGNSFSHHGLAASRWPVKHDALDRLDSESFEHFRMLKRKFSDFLYFALDMFIASDIVPENLRNFDDQFLDLWGFVVFQDLFNAFFWDFVIVVCVGLSYNLLDLTNAETVHS